MEMTAYILHTVDSATALINSPRSFPSRYVTAPVFTLQSPYTYSFFFSRLQIPVASHRHFSSLARRLGRGRILALSTSTIVKHMNKQILISIYAPFLDLTERFELVPAEFLIIPTDDHNVGGIGDSLGTAPSWIPRYEHRLSNEFDRGYQEQQQRYD